MLPSILDVDGTKPMFGINGSPVRDTDGNKHWWLNGKLHRTDGPAAEYATGDKVWWLNGEQHRTDGPAVEHSDGGKAWYLNGMHYNFDKWLIENEILTDEEKVMMKLQHG
jgi:hypothetical protein